MKTIKRFKEDWKLATNRERIKFVLVTLLELVAGISSWYFVAIGIHHESFMEIMYSYGLFIVVFFLSKIKLTPKARNEAS